VALVTGGSRGIGRATALALAAAGHPVAVNFASRVDAAEDAVAEITAAGGRAAAFRADVADEAQVEGLFADVAVSLGPVLVLVNNAGVTRDTLVARMKTEDWDAVLHTNLRSAFLCSRAVSRAMLRARWGRIVSVSSIAGVTGNPGQANYAASKAGLIGFSKSLARELGARPITVNVVAPGFIETDMTAVLPVAVHEGLLPRIPLGRYGHAGEVAGAVAYLVSDAAAYVTGHVLVVDGGLAM